MFASAYHAKMSFLTVLNVRSSHPLALWSRRGSVRFVREALELQNQQPVEGDDESNVDTAIICPSFHESLAISLPILNFVLRWLDDADKKTTFSIEIHVTDDHETLRRIRISPQYKSAVVVPELACVPLKPMLLDDAAAADSSSLWQTIQLDLPMLTHRFYPHVNYRRTERIVLEAPCQVRFIFFSSRLVASDLWPVEYRSVT